MTAATETRLTSTREGYRLAVDVAASTLLIKGTLVAIDSSGNAVAASADATLKIAGKAREEYDNSSGVAGDVVAEVEHGCFRWENSAGGDAITVAHRGKVCYAVDNQTVALTSSNGSRPIAGIVEDVDSDGVWVRTDFTTLEAGAGPDAGARMAIVTTVDTLVGTATKRVVCPIAAKVVSINTVIEGALATGDAVLTGKISGTAITDGVVTITQAGSAAGDVDTATPSAANVAAAGDTLDLTLSGTQSNAVAAEVTWLLEAL